MSVYLFLTIFNDINYKFICLLQNIEINSTFYLLFIIIIILFLFFSLQFYMVNIYINYVSDIKFHCESSRDRGRQDKNYEKEKLTSNTDNGYGIYSQVG